MDPEDVSFEQMVIHERAAAEHDDVCSKGPKCANRTWHIGNDYLRRAQRERVAELMNHLAAAKAALEVRPYV